MRELYGMSLVLEMDRPIDKDKHYISPGGYELNGKPFDFNSYEGYVNPDSPCLLECVLSDFDETLGEDEDIVVRMSDINKGFTEFYVYTGENGEPEISPVAVREITFEMYDPKTGKYSKVDASNEVLESANKVLAA